jgi:hypothetical protein
MSAIPKILPQENKNAVLKQPTIFDLTAYFEPSSHYRFSRRVRNQFDDLARRYSSPTWLLGRFGGKARMQTDISGIGVASRVEVGRLSMREGSQEELIKSAFTLFDACGQAELVSGDMSRLLVYFKHCDKRQRERDLIRQAFAEVFDGRECCFLNAEVDMLEIGQAVKYQSLVQYMREDGPFHSKHRNRIDKVQRHLQQEVGRYENHHFFVRPGPGGEGIPKLDFVYTGSEADRTVEAFIEGYTDEKVIFIDPERFKGERSQLVGLKDYERASRRFGGVWVLQDDIVRLLLPQEVSVLYLFFDSQMQPETGRHMEWDDLYQRQRISPYVPPASRNSQTFLDMLLEGLVRKGFITELNGEYLLAPGFEHYQHVTFYTLGDYGKRQR